MAVHQPLGDFLLMIEKFDQSWGCLSGQMNPQTDGAVAPGESVVIRAAFTPGLHRGLVPKSPHVRFVGHNRPVEFVVEARVPHSIEISTREIIWETVAASASQVICANTSKHLRIWRFARYIINFNSSYPTNRRQRLKPRHHRRIEMIVQCRPSALDVAKSRVLIPESAKSG